MNKPASVPVFFDPADSVCRRRIATVTRSKSVRVVDPIQSYLDELYAIRNPQSIRTGVSIKDRAAFRRALIPDGDESRYGMWVYFPWNKTLVHVLPEAEHTELRTARNRNLITPVEQQRWYQSSVGVAGLSVGNAVVSAIVQTGGGKYLRLADCDEVSTSNINRIRAGISDVGTNKLDLAARYVFEVNPYASIIAYNEGITEQNIERFLCDPKPLSVVIDEMDTLHLKILLRKIARRHRIPVVMAADNGDGAVIDVERFDKEPDRPLLHGVFSERELDAISPTISRMDAAKIISTWVGVSNTAMRMKESLMEIGRSLYTWPQLGTAAFLSGTIVSYVARRIVLGETLPSGKTVISLDQLFDPTYEDPVNVKRREAVTRAYLHAIGVTTI